MNRKVIWWQPEVGTSELDRVKEVLASNYLNDGAVTEEFESRLQQLLRVKHVVAVTSGTTALFLALKAAGIGNGDEVIVPDMTFIASANAVSLTGATPVLADIDSRTLNLCVDSVRTHLTQKTRAIMPVHVSGRACNMTELAALAQEANVPIVEDAAEALLSMHDGQSLGTIGLFGCFSLSPNKTISTGQGGLIACNDSDLHRKLRMLKDQGRPTKGTGGDDTHAEVGFNFKFTNLQAAIGLGQLDLLQARLEHLRGIYTQYRHHLANVAGVTLLEFKVESGETPQWIDALVDNRDELCRFLDSRNIGYRKFWHPLHTQPPYRRDDAQFPNSTACAPKALWLPSSFGLTQSDIEYVCQSIKEFAKQAVSANG